MAKTDKELAVDVAKAVIEANSVKFGIASNNTPRQTSPVSLDSIQSIISGVYITLQDLPVKE